MRRNVEAAGVHLADCTLLDYRRELEHEEKAAAAKRSQQYSTAQWKENAKCPVKTAKQLVSPYTRVDGELISTNIALSSLLRAEEERKERLALEEQQKKEVEALFQLHDGMRTTIIDQWSLGMEKLVLLEKRDCIRAQCKERCRRASDWWDALAEQHLADEILLWADEEQVMARERDEGRAAYRQRSVHTRK
ncbi:hypothetical protein TcG_01351 [Trypanosoma cruzi]|nr:hypothetical protein BCY84_20533 [Trypanosoma cruzi cruzi]RNF23711.1 hypothetical protein TcG_01351 [Trypanosoma cruzi]